MDRIRVIERSLACYAYGWLSCIPLVGLALAVRAIKLYRQARAEAGRDWNPAGRYLVCGVLLACLGGLVSAITLGLILVLLVRAMGDLS